MNDRPWELTEEDLWPLRLKPGDYMVCDVASLARRKLMAYLWPPTEVLLSVADKQPRAGDWDSIDAASVRLRAAHEALKAWADKQEEKKPHDS